MTATRAQAARQANTPWRGLAVKQTLGSNAQLQRAAFKRMTECERLTGLTIDQIEALHAEQRARVRARYEVPR